MVKVGPAPQWAPDPGLTNQSPASPWPRRLAQDWSRDPIRALQAAPWRGPRRKPLSWGCEWPRPKSGDRCTRVCYNAVVYACLLLCSDLPVLKVLEVERERNQKAAQKDPVGLWYDCSLRHTWTFMAICCKMEPPSSHFCDSWWTLGRKKGSVRCLVRESRPCVESSAGRRHYQRRNGRRASSRSPRESPQVKGRWVAASRCGWVWLGLIWRSVTLNFSCASEQV